TPSICSCIHDTVCSALLEMDSVTPSGPLAPDSDDDLPALLLSGPEVLALDLSAADGDSDGVGVAAAVPDVLSLADVPAASESPPPFGLEPWPMPALVASLGVEPASTPGFESASTPGVEPAPSPVAESALGPEPAC